MSDRDKFIIRLRSGQKLPALGLGTYAPKESEDDVIRAVRAAIKTGYRHLDCAAIYRNERAVGHAIKQLIVEGVIKREDLFITSKLWNTCHRPDLVRASLKKSLDDLGLKYLDLYLIHWPMGLKEGEAFHPKDENGKIMFSDVDYVDTWKALEDCVDEGLVKNIGVSNFSSKQIKRILEVARIKPSNNQVEIHVHLANQKLVEYCHENGIAVTAYSPLGAPGNASVPFTPSLEEPVIKEIAQKKKKTPAQVTFGHTITGQIETPTVILWDSQVFDKYGLLSSYSEKETGLLKKHCQESYPLLSKVIIRFLLQRGLSVIPKSVTVERIEENFQVFDFSLSEDEMQQIFSLNKDHRLNIEEIALDHKYYPFNDPF